MIICQRGGHSGVLRSRGHDNNNLRAIRAKRKIWWQLIKVIFARRVKDDDPWILTRLLADCNWWKTTCEKCKCETEERHCCIFVSCTLKTFRRSTTFQRKKSGDAIGAVSRFCGFLSRAKKERGVRKACCSRQVYRRYSPKMATIFLLITWKIKKW